MSTVIQRLLVCRVQKVQQIGLTLLLGYGVLSSIRNGDVEHHQHAMTTLAKNLFGELSVYDRTRCRAAAGSISQGGGAAAIAAAAHGG